jgi:hypothetical protein
VAEKDSRRAITARAKSDDIKRMNKLLENNKGRERDKDIQYCVFIIIFACVLALKYSAAAVR